MVVFNCNACGEALKKNQVEKHYTTQCRKCEVLSCVDCGKEFWGNDYEQHTKCVSEEQKYGGKNFKPKANANKGEQKQELWVNQVHAAVSKVKTNIKLKNLLEQLVDYPNIPRKKAKFENFLRNSLRVYESSMATAAWDAISAELSVNNNNNSQNGNKAEKNGSAPETATVTCETEKNSDKTEQSDEDSGTQSKKKKKDKMKNRDEGKVVEETTEMPKSESERQEKSKKKSKKEKRTEKNGVNEGENTAKQNGDSVHGNGEHVGNRNEDKKKKKRKIDEVEQEQNGECKNKKKKNKHSTDDDDSTTVNADTSIADGAQTDITSPVEGSFKWDAAIVGVLKRAPDQQLKLSKLRKKVLAEFNARGGDGKIYAEEKLMSKFDKKLHNSQKFKLNKDLVKLVKR